MKPSLDKVLFIDNFNVGVVFYFTDQTVKDRYLAFFSGIINRKLVYP